MSGLCDLCFNIKFEDLPFEEESGYAHHTWKQLNLLYKECNLCTVIRYAVSRLDSQLEQECANSRDPCLWNGTLREGAVPGIDGDMRIWLFWNWWALEKGGPLNQLIGFGVRLRVSGWIDDAEGTSDDRVRMRGTYLRVCT
jgi:hypothetical protein